MLRMIQRMFSDIRETSRSVFRQRVSVNTSVKLNAIKRDRETGIRNIAFFFSALET